MKKLKKKIKFKPVKNVLKDPTCLKDLKELKDHFVLVPIDKAANNVGKKYCNVKNTFWKYFGRKLRQRHMKSMTTLLKKSLVRSEK